MIYKLADRVQLVEVEGRIFFVDDELVEVEGCSAAQYRALQLLKEGCSSEQLEGILDAQARGEMLDLLEEMQLLRTNWSNEYAGDIVEKQIFYLDDFSTRPNELQRRLAGATVAIVGVGGVGGVVLQHLAGAGVKSFVLIDQDCVQRDNQNRQFLYPSRCIGQPKVEAAKEYLHQIDRAIDVRTHQLMIDGVESLHVLDGQRIDLLINAADQPAELFRYINHYCTQHDIPWVGAGVGRHSGTWGPLVIPGQTMCMECFHRSEDEEMDELEGKIRKRIQPTIQASFGATNTVISALLAKDAILYLALQDKEVAASAGTRCVMDFRSLQVHRSAPEGADAACSCWKGSAACAATV